MSYKHLSLEKRHCIEIERKKRFQLYNPQGKCIKISLDKSFQDTLNPVHNYRKKE